MDINKTQAQNSGILSRGDDSQRLVSLLVLLFSRAVSQLIICELKSPHLHTKWLHNKNPQGRTLTCFIKTHKKTIINLTRIK